MHSGLAKFYVEFEPRFRSKGSQPNQSSLSKVAELAFVGDKLISLYVAKQLILNGLSNAEATVVMGEVLSNASFSEIARKLELPIGSGVHANGTLLEAMVGFWHLSASFELPSFAEDADQPIYDRYSEAFHCLLDYLSAQCLNKHRNNSFVALFNLSDSDALALQLKQIQDQIKALTQ